MVHAVKAHIYACINGHAFISGYHNTLSVNMIILLIPLLLTTRSDEIPL